MEKSHKYITQIIKEDCDNKQQTYLFKDSRLSSVSPIWFEWKVGTCKLLTWSEDNKKAKCIETTILHNDSIDAAISAIESFVNMIISLCPSLVSNN